MIKDVTVYLRYRPLIDFLRKEKKGDRIKVLELGSGEQGIGPFLKKKFWGIDVNFPKKKSRYLIPVISSATKLPSDWSNHFDVVLSVDMLEHLSPLERRQSLKEMIRVAKKTVLVTFPSGGGSRIVDRILDFYYQKTHGERLDFLKEHLKYPLPDKEKVLNVLLEEAKKQNKKVLRSRLINNTSIFLYLFFLLLGFSENRYLTRLFLWCYSFRKVFSYFNLFPYRRVIILEFDLKGSDEN